MSMKTTYCGALLTFLVTTTGAQPLLDATHDAAVLCFKLGEWSMDHCGTEMNGNSAEHSAARHAVGRAYKERAAFLRDCKDSRVMGPCMEQAEWLMGAGLARAAGELPSDPPPSEPSVHPEIPPGARR